MGGGHKLSNTKITKICAELEQTGEYIPVGRHVTEGCKGIGDWSEESNMMVQFKLTDLQSVPRGDCFNSQRDGHRRESGREVT